MHSISKFLSGIENDKQNNNSKWNQTAKEYLVQEFCKFEKDNTTGINPALALAPPKVLKKLQLSHPFLCQFSDKTFPLNFRNTVNDFNVNRRKEGARKKQTGKFFSFFFLNLISQLQLTTFNCLTTIYYHQ